MWKTSDQVKLQILREIEVEKKKTDVAQKHNIPQSSLSTIIKNSEKIHQQALHAGESSRKRARGSTYADVDKALLQWFKQARSAALPVNGPLLSEKAKTLALEFGLKDFTGSGGWIERWKARHGIKLRNICGESADVNRETMTNWLTDVMPNIISNYACKGIFNADETGLFWRLLPDKTLHFKGETCTGGKAKYLMQEFVKRKLRMYRKSNAGFGYDGIPILLLNISSGYCIQIICLLLMISGIEPNPGPKKQTTLFTEPTPTVKESADTELKTMIVQMSSEIRNLGERIDTRLSNIEKRMIEWDQRLLGVEMKLTTYVETLAATNEIVSENVTKLREIEARTDFLEMKLREPNLVFYGVEGEANEGPAESLQKVKSIIKEKMQILESLNITNWHRLGKANKSPILISLPENEDRIKLFKNTTKLYINTDYSKKIRDQRLILIAKRKELFEKGTRSKLRDNKLIVNGVVYEAVNGQVVSNNGNKI
ncbi:TIGD4 [Cordylochernes scorpioides]|uniref:TIGD4 n=1 Tax=Cordylochernes scorpioides TaxID=51811 RepID=A0ABY6KLF7_9ARAC|nr:TIGD4 [Cordylochernes scorpioides]